MKKLIYSIPHQFAFNNNNAYLIPTFQNSRQNISYSSWSHYLVSTFHTSIPPHNITGVTLNRLGFFLNEEWVDVAFLSEFSCWANPTSMPTKKQTQAIKYDWFLGQLTPLQVNVTLLTNKPFDILIVIRIWSSNRNFARHAKFQRKTM